MTTSRRNASPAPQQAIGATMSTSVGRGRLPRWVLDWSLRSIELHDDNDLFTRPFEFEVFRRNWSQLAVELLDLRVDCYRWSEPRKLLLPKDRVSFRRACQLDPLDSLVLTALVKLVGARIEARRQPRDVVFSSRFGEAGDSLYDSNFGWEQFWGASKMRAEREDITFVARTDVTDFYNQIRQGEILEQLAIAGLPDRLCQAFAGFLKAFGGGLGRGVPIGPHAGHLLAELSLVRADALLAARRIRFNRYVDDYHIFCTTEREAQLALFDLADVLDSEFGLSLNRMKTSVSAAKEFVVEARQRAREETPSAREEALLDAIRAVTDSDYDFAKFEDVFAQNPNAVSDETIEALLLEHLNPTTTIDAPLGEDLDPPRIDYPKLGWLLRRFSQVEAPGGIDFILQNFEEFVPVIGDTARYLARAGKNWKGQWSDLGSAVLGHVTNPIVEKSHYVQAVLFSLFAEQKELNHLGDLLQHFDKANDAAKRELLLAARTAGASDWLHHLRAKVNGFDSWSRRAFVYATGVLPPRQQEECLRAISAQPVGADSILLGALLAERQLPGGGPPREPAGPGWAALLAQVPKDRRELVEGRLEGLGQALHDAIYSQLTDDRFMVATWNLRNFGGGVFGFSDRLPESLVYIARVLLAFDLVAIQEIRDKENVDRLLTLLGAGWNKVICGEAPGREGNSERSAFLYRSAKARCRGEVEQLVLAKKDLILGKHQFARPPFLVGFDVGRSRLTACTAHTYFGAERGPKLQRRIAEIAALAALVIKRARKEDATAILLGDMNVVGPSDPTMAPLRKHDIALAKEFLMPTNAKGDKFFTQIAFKPSQAGPRLMRAGVFPLFDHVFRSTDVAIYQEEMIKSAAWDTRASKGKLPLDPKQFYATWRTFQMSDHFPVWVEFAV
jgi:hypothetical protein